MNLNDWITAVHQELDSYGYDVLTYGYDVKYIATGMSQVMSVCYPLGWSHRMCALCILGITYENLIIPSREQVKH